MTLRVVDGSVNYLEWKRNWTHHFSGYGMAGKELLENRNIRSLLLRPTNGAAQIFEPIQVDDRVQAVGRALTAQDRSNMPKLQADWDKAQESYERSRGYLLGAILDSIEASISTDVQNQPTFDGILQRCDHRALWNLIQTVVNMRGGSQVNLVNNWRKEKQRGRKLADHILKFEQLLANIDQGFNGINERAKAEQLVRSVDFARYESILGQYSHLMEQPVPAVGADPFPTYNDLKNRLIRFEAMKEDAISYDDEPESKVLYSSYQSSSSKDIPMCYNCNLPGHYSRDCTNPPSCRRCGGEHKTNEHQYGLRNQNQKRDRKLDIPKGYKLVKEPTSSHRLSTSSTSNSRGSLGLDNRKPLKKPFNIKSTGNEKAETTRSVKRVYYVEESDNEDNTFSKAQSEDEQMYHDADLMDEDDDQ